MISSLQLYFKDAGQITNKGQSSLKEYATPRA